MRERDRSNNSVASRDAAGNGCCGDEEKAGSYVVLLAHRPPVGVIIVEARR